MSSKGLIKETKLTITISLLASIALFATWAILETMNLSFTDNKAFLALSLIPLSLALASFLKLKKIKNDPKVIVAETDERLISQKNEADAYTLKLLQVVIFFFYLGYTFIVPEDVFKAIGWWATLSIVLLSLLAQSTFRHIICRKNNKSI